MVARLLIGLQKTSKFKQELYNHLLIDNEFTRLEYVTIRDRVIFTNKRMIIIDVQGLTGKKKSYLSVPYSKMTAYECESNGRLDLDAELKIYANGLPEIKLEFLRGTNVFEISKLIAENSL